MSEAEVDRHLYQLLESDRVWCAYALADLDPAEAEHSTWLVSEKAVILIYKGLDPPVLFVHGDPEDLRPLVNRVPCGVYQYTLKRNCRLMLADRLQSRIERHMWRMVLNRRDFPRVSNVDLKSLVSDDLPAIRRLFESSPDMPDSFHERQLTIGPFFGIREGDELLSIAGVHVLSQWAKVAAVGNVFTRSDRRGQGLAMRASAAVVKDLLEQNIQTIVLNVAIDNEPALRCYRRLGFQPYCDYYEGTGTLIRDDTKVKPRDSNSTSA
ncbi:MAG: GNAT family N-acetyltransferase [Anaerolineales bacterium]|nr:GNAT family N-acetyltransferase [Anaerolineales bacterium]